MVDVQSYQCDFENKWCPGCGNFMILDAMKEALAGLDLPPEKVLLVSGIGQAAKTPHFMKCNFFHGLHGRALPVATGAKLANHELTVLVNSGDGDCYGEGGNHFLSAIRRNIDLTLIVHNNKVYGLTKGQASPTSDPGFTTKIQRGGVISGSFPPLAVALSMGAGFVARGFSGSRENLNRILQRAIRHKGFSLVDVLQPCVSFNHVNTFAWYKKRVKDLLDTDYDPTDWELAMKTARQWGDEIPIGVLFEQAGASFTDKLPQLAEGPLVRRSYDADRLQSLME
ncbi:MAG TPA: thiamine pyrophosphate-dependent enzyme [Desulfosalsimonadaceae bacterium]|nr:thiamine pyrophosphate-dependent enzyme [Desulfosalsimonadaceae bacterium]